MLLSLKVPLSYIPHGFFFSYWVVARILPRVLDKILLNLHKMVSLSLSYFRSVCKSFLALFFFQPYTFM